MTNLSGFGIFKARLPLPFKLDHVNCYAVKGSGGWTVIDTGLYNGETRRAWERFMEKHAFKPTDIKAIYVTHHHPDHYGSSGWLQQLSGAPVYMSVVEAGFAKLIWSQQPRVYKIIADFFLENGVPEKLTGEILKGIILTSMGIYDHPTVTPLSAGDEVELGGFRYRAVITPGHSDEHVCLYCAETGILFSGDHLLPKITSNISLWPHFHPDPLDSFFNSLAENRLLKTNLVLPAHGDFFTNMQERLTQLEEHHRHRLELMKEAVGANGSTVFEVSGKLFGGDISLHEARFALTETLAHLVYLEKRGHLRVARENGRNVYHRLHDS